MTPKTRPLIDLQRKKPGSLVTRDMTCLSLRHPDGWLYPVSIDRIVTPGQVIWWLHHLAKKRWVTKGHLRDFIEAIPLAIIEEPPV